MAIFKDPELIYRTMEREKTPFFTVSDRSGIIVENDDDISVEDARILLHENLQALEGVVTVRLRRKKKAATARGGDIKTGNFVYELRLGNTANQSINGNSSLADYWAEKMNRAIDKMNYEAQLKEKEREIEALRDGGNPLYEKALNGIISALPTLMNGSARPAIAGVGDAPIEAPQKPKDPNRVMKVLKRLGAIDPDIINTLEKLATFAEANPEQFLMLKSQLPA